VRLADISEEPTKDMTKATQRFEVLGRELFDLQDAMFGAKLNTVIKCFRNARSLCKSR
jgi:hypothetical protein